MTRLESTAHLTRALGRLTDEQLAALASLADTLATTGLIDDGDDATRAAIAEGVDQAKRGEFVPRERAEALLKKPWR